MTGCSTKLLAGWRILAVVAAAPLASCATADRTGAARLADTGIGISRSLVAEVQGRQQRIRDAAADSDFNDAYSTMARCRDASGRAAITRTGVGPGVDPNCDVLATAKRRKEGVVAQTAAKLADAVAKRAAAADALGAAYRAFGAEAEYDAAGDLEDAIGKATASVDAFATAVGAAPVVAVAMEAVRQISGLGAERAQRRRLLRANARLRTLSAGMAAALVRERAQHVAIGALLGKLEEETSRNLVRAGLLNPAPTLRGIADRAGVPIGGDGGVQVALTRDPVLDAAAAVATLSRREPVRDDAFAAALGALGALDAQHAAYAARRPVSARDAAVTLERLAEVARATDR